MIISSIKKHFPNHNIIGEESSSGSSLDSIKRNDNNNNNPTWIIDPIDGTTNFASGFPLCCVSIGLCNEYGIPVLGVVYSPNTNEIYTAIKGRGAFRNHVRINTTTKRNNEKKKKKTLQNSVVCFELGYTKEKHNIDVMLNAIKNLLYNGVRAVRSTGCGVLDLCYVALGKMDVVYTGLTTEGWKPWDYCAGMVIVLESGSFIEPLLNDDDDDDGKKEKGLYEDVSFDIYSSSMICAITHELLDECRKVVLKKD